jgi:carboxymethylenebutenolidase
MEESLTMTANTMRVRSADGIEFDAYVSRPQKLPAPAVIVIQEIFGVNEWLRSVADWLAQQGFLAVAPDLFFRQEPGIQLTDKTEAEWQKAFKLYEGFDENQGVEDLIATVLAVRSMPDCTSTVGTLGFCLGGKLAYRMSTRSDASANVSYYGVGIEKNLEETVRNPLILHIAEADPYVPGDAQSKIKQRLEGNQLVTIYTYAGMDHAFGRPGSQHYNREAAELAHKRTLEFLNSKLAAVPAR